MHQKCTLFVVCSLLLNLNGLFFFQGPNAVSASGPSDIIGDIYRGKIRAIIEKTSILLGSWKPLSYFTPLEETCTINQTTSSLDVRIITSNTVSSMTGGIFGRDVYQFYKFSFYWKDDTCNDTYNLISQVHWFNLKYGSYRNALNYEDGIVLNNFPIATNGDYDNPKFAGLMNIMKTKIAKPGDCAIIDSSFTYRFFVNFPYGSIYHTTRGEFVDEVSGKKYTALMIELPLDQRVNYISNEQYKATFGKMKGISPPPFVDNLFQSDRVDSMERHKGINVINLPA